MGKQAGNRVWGGGFAAKKNEITQLTVGSDGRIDVPLVVPDDLGGLHGVSIRAASQSSRRRTSSRDQRRRNSPMSGPAGNPVSIHLKGVGWTDYDNIYVVTYDNAYMDTRAASIARAMSSSLQGGGFARRAPDRLYSGIYQG